MTYSNVITKTNVIGGDAGPSRAGLFARASQGVIHSKLVLGWRFINLASLAK